MSKWKSQPWWTGATAGAIAFAVPASVRPDVLAGGGLAPLVVAAAVAGIVGWPTAVSVWRSEVAGPNRWTPWAESLGRLLLPVTLAAIWVSALPGLLGWMSAVILWIGLGFGGPSRAAHVLSLIHI